MAYASDKYDVKALRQRCQERMRTTINTGNVLDTLNMSLTHEDSITKDACLQYIYYHTNDVFSIEEFLNIPHSCILVIMKEHKLNLSEDDVFNHLFRWVEAECNRRNINGLNGPTVRRVLGSEILESILFYQMSKDYFRTTITQKLSGLLKESKTTEIAQFLFSDRVIPPDPEFPKRLIFIRFRKTSSGKMYSRGNEDALSFTLSETVKLHSLMVYGSCQYPGQYNIDVTIVREPEKQIMFKAENIKKETDGHVKLHEIPVSTQLTSIVFEKSKRYSIFMKMRGRTSFFGEGGRQQMTCEGTTIEFFTNLDGLNGTTRDHGQFPGFILEKIN